MANLDDIDRNIQDATMDDLKNSLVQKLHTQQLETANAMQGGIREQLEKVLAALQNMAPQNIDLQTLQTDLQEVLGSGLLNTPDDLKQVNTLDQDLLHKLISDLQTVEDFQAQDLDKFEPAAKYNKEIQTLLENLKLLHRETNADLIKDLQQMQANAPKVKELFTDIKSVLEDLKDVPGFDVEGVYRAGADAQ